MKSWSGHSSLGEYLQTLAEVYGDNPCISELRSGRILSYIELESQSRSAAAQLFDMGLQVGDQFGMITRNQIEFLFGTWLLSEVEFGSFRLIMILRFQTLKILLRALIFAASLEQTQLLELLRPFVKSLSFYIPFHTSTCWMVID